MKTRKGLEPYSVKIDDATFFLRPLTTPEMVSVLDSIRYGRSKAMFEACELALTGWEGLEDEQGEPMPFSQEDVRWLPAEAVATLTGRIISDNRLSDHEKKTSSQP